MWGSGRGLIKLDLQLLVIMLEGYNPNHHDHQCPSRIEFHFTLSEL